MLSPHWPFLDCGAQLLAISGCEGYVVSEEYEGWKVYVGCVAKEGYVVDDEWE